MTTAPAKNRLQLSDNPILAQAQQLLARQNYLEFLVLADEAEQSLSGEDLGELYAMRAQVKIFTIDETVQDDLRMAKRLLPEGSKLPTLGTRFRSNTPKPFTVLNPQGGALSRYKLALSKSLPTLEKICGPVGLEMAHLCEADILYTVGNFEKAADIALPIYQHTSKGGNQYVAIIAGFVLVRCYVALSEPDKLETVMAQMIRYSRILSRPAYRSMYNDIKAWVNATTGWMGETPRYHITPNGDKLPVLDDRTIVMQEGITDLIGFEAALIMAARYKTPKAISMKDIYSRIYHAMITFKLGNKSEAVDQFYEIYTVTQKNRIVMPFVEYGAQILPLLHYALSRKDSARFARRWSDKLNQMATQYEEALKIIRGELQEELAAGEPLTETEEEVLRLMMDDMTIAEIAESMDVHNSQVKDHIRGIYRKLGVHNRYEAVAKARGSKILHTIKL